MAPPAVGIDLGTTNSVAASVDAAGRPFSIPAFDGAVLTPSMVLVEGRAVTVGREAGKAAPFHPERFAEYFKRYIGHDAYPRAVDGRTWRPEVLSALVLRRLRNDVTRRLGPVEEAVVTVPAYFDELRRRATWNAAVIAGWQPVDLINEPTAAAIAYAHRHGGPPADQPVHVLVYDLGGGTFDVTVLQIVRGREYRALATDGDARLGGQDWDNLLAAVLAEQFKRKSGTDPMAAARSKIEFMQVTRQVKHNLSSRKKVTAPCACAGKKVMLEAERAEFERLTLPLLNRTRMTTELVLGQARKTWADIDRVLLVGGATRMPMVGAMFEQLTGRPPDATLDADEAVAHGAAVYAALRRQPDGPRVVDVNSHSYRVLCHDRQRRLVAVSMVDRNTPLPAEATRPFPISQAALSKVAITVVEGEVDDPTMCEALGEIVVQIPPAVDDRKRLAYVTVVCRADGGLTGMTRVKVAGDKEDFAPATSVELVPRKGLTAEQVAEYRRWMDTLELG